MENNSSVLWVCFKYEQLILGLQCIMCNYFILQFLLKLAAATAVPYLLLVWKEGDCSTKYCWCVLSKISGHLSSPNQYSPKCFSPECAQFYWDLDVAKYPKWHSGWLLYWIFFFWCFVIMKWLLFSYCGLCLNADTSSEQNCECAEGLLLVTVLVRNVEKTCRRCFVIWYKRK